jgi:hypothetical protein
MINPYEPPTRQEPSDMTTLQKAGLSIVIGAVSLLVVLLAIPANNPIGFFMRLVLAMFAAVPLVMGLLYGLANLLIGQEDF